jgi:hypothetical protein
LEKKLHIGPWRQFEILDRIEDELWTKFQYSYEFMTFSVWSSNLIKLQFDPKNLPKIPE